MPAPIFLEADLYGPLARAAALILFGLFFPPGALSANGRQVARWPWIAVIAAPTLLYTVVDILLVALRRGAEATGQSALPYRLGEIAALVLVIGLILLVVRRRGSVKRPPA